MKNIQEKYIQPGEWLVNAIAVNSRFCRRNPPAHNFTAGFGWSSARYLLLTITLISFISLFGLMVINPNESKVLTFSGNA